MTQQATAPAAPQAPAEPGSGVTIVPSLEERAAAAFGMSEPADESGAAPPADPSAVGSATPEETARAARREALAVATAKERERVDLMAHRREADSLRERLAAAEAREKAREGKPGHIDPSALDAPGFLDIARSLNASGKLTAQQLGDFIREQTANPELAAARAATSLVDPKLAALEARNAALESKLNEFLQGQQTQREQAEEQRAANEFFTFTSSNASVSPRAAGFLGEFGQDQFYKLALKASESVPQSAGPQAILDEIEDNLARIRYLPPQAAATQRTPAPSIPQNHAAAKAPTTISNTLAQQRATVVDEDADWASLPFEERSARLFR